MVEINKVCDEGPKSCNKLHYTISAFVIYFYSQSIVRIFYNHICIKSKHKPILYFVLKKYINEIESWFCKCKFIGTFTRKLKGSLIFKKISLLHYIDYFKNPINSKIGFNVMLNIFGHVRNFLIIFFFYFSSFFLFCVIF